MTIPRFVLRSFLALGVASACATTPVATIAPAPTPALAAPAGPVAKQITSVEGITEYELPNGMRVLLFPEPSKPTITVNITYLVGSRFEGYGETGMAHLLEHMLFKGSTNHTNIPQELTSHGARPNGTTSYDRTNYFETFAASDENLTWALSLEADRMVHSFVAKKALDTEMTVVRNEYEMGENNPENILEERTLSSAYLWHNYGKPTIGARSDIENVPIEHLQAFYRRFYQPDNAVLLVSGKFDAAKTLALIEQNFAPIPKPDRQLDPTYTREPAQDGERSVTLRRSGDVQAVAAAYHIPAASHPDAAALDLLSDVIGSSPSGRLYKALVETKKAASVGAYAMIEDEPGILYASANVRVKDSIEDAKTALLATLDAAATAPVTKEEVERARAEELKNVELTLANAERIGLVLSEWIARGDWRLYFLHRDRLRAVTPEDVQRVAAQYLVPTNRTVGVFVPTQKAERVAVPEAPAVPTMLAGYKGDPETAKGEAFDPSPANIESRTTRVDLPGGMKLALLPKKTRGATVNVSMTLRFGDEKSLAGFALVPQTTASMLMRGTSKHTREQIRDEFDRLKARVNIGHAGPGVLSVGIETIRENLPKTLDLVAEVLRDATFPQKELDQLRQEWIADLEQQKSDPPSIARIALNRHLAPFEKADPRYVPTLEEQIADITSVKRDELVKFHKNFYGSSNAQLAVVGDFDADTTKAQLDSLLGSWKSPKAFARVPNVYFDRPMVTLSFETPDKENAVFRAGLNLPLRDDDMDYPAMTLGNWMIGGGFLNSRLAKRIRQKEGISYGVGSFFYASAVDQVGAFGAQAIYAPQNADRVAKAFDEEIHTVLSGGFEAPEIADAKTGWLQSRELQRSQDGGLAMQLATYLFINRNFKWDDALEKKVLALDAATIHDALNRHITPDKLSRVRAGDFARVAPKEAGK